MPPGPAPSSATPDGMSHIAGSTWDYDEATGEYYLHLFAKEQPDLNWENEEARNAIYDSSMRFWLDKGVDGFRVDCVNMYSKGLEFPDAPIINPAAYEQPGVSETRLMQSLHPPKLTTGFPVVYLLQRTKDS